MKKIQFQYNGFHGIANIVFMDTGIHRTEYQIMDPFSIEDVTVLFIGVSDSVARRLNKQVCGNRDCMCGEHVARWDEATRRYWVRVYGEKRGNYPQSF